MHRVGYRDGTAPEAEAPGRLRSDAARKCLVAWDALAGAHRDEAADAARRRRDLAAAAAGKLAGRERDVQEQDASYLLAHWFVRSERQDAGVELCTRGAVRFAEQSCAAQAAAADPRLPVEQPDAAEQVQPEAQQRRRLMVVQERMAQRSELSAVPWAAAAAERPEAAPVEQLKQQAFPLARTRLEVGVRAREPKVRQVVVQQQAQLALERPEALRRTSPQPGAQAAQDEPAERRPLPSFE